MAKRDTHIIGCVPCVDGLKMGYVPYKHSSVGKCSSCGCEVWVGPETRKVHEKDGVPYVCLNCIVKSKIAGGGELAFEKLTNKKMGE